MSVPTVMTPIRMPADVREYIDRACAREVPSPSRTAWIIRAIVEALPRDLGQELESSRLNP